MGLTRLSSGPSAASRQDNVRFQQCLKSLMVWWHIYGGQWVGCIIILSNILSHVIWSGTGAGSLTSSQTTVPAAPLSGPPTTAAPLGARFLFLKASVRFQSNNTAHLRMLHFQLAPLWMSIVQGTLAPQVFPQRLGSTTQTVLLTPHPLGWASGLRCLFLNSSKWV